jgi:ComF family protein
MAYRWIERIRSFAYPPVCLLCESAGHDNLDICRACADTLPGIDRGCARCALPVTLPNVTLCGACQRRPPHFQSACALYRYEAPVDHLIRQLKFHGRLPYARLLGCLLGDHLAQRLRDLPDCIVPVPLHPRRLRERGFNQSLELARHAGRRLRIPVDYACVSRTRHTHPQTELPAKLRRKNMRGAFQVTETFGAEHVAILDDVVTTGATVNELARALHRAGVQRVDVWCVARAT